MLVLDVGMQVAVCVKALAVGVLRQAVPKVAAEMRCLRCSLDSSQLLVLYSLPSQLSQLACVNAAIASDPGNDKGRFRPC